MQKATGADLHHFLTRDIFFAHRDFDLILKAVEELKYQFINVERIPNCLHFIFILEEVHLQKLCILDICFPLYLTNIYRKLSMFLWLFKLQMMKSISGKETQSKISRISLNLHMKTLKILLLLDLILRKLSSSLIASTLVICTQISVDSKSTLI